MILGTDGKKLSKRHGATAVGDYQHQGILPLAMRNFLALLGWSPGGDREILPEAEMIELFSLEGIQRKPAVFDTTKLEWMNGQYLSARPAEELLPAVREHLDELGVQSTRDLAPLIDAVKARSRTLLDIANQVAVRLDRSRIVRDAKGAALAQKLGPAFAANLQTGAAGARRGGPGPPRPSRPAQGAGRAGREEAGRPDATDSGGADRRDRVGAGQRTAGGRRPGGKPGPHGRGRRGMSLRLALAGLGLAGALQAQDAAPGRGLMHEPFPLTLVFTGDINMGTRTLPEGIPPDSGRQLFAAVDSLLRGDLVIGNFEGVLSDSGESAKCAPNSTRCYAFATPTWLAPRLKDAGFTHLNLANNHANDFGIEGRQHTESVLRELGLVPYGPLDMVAITPVVREDGSFTLVAVVGFTTYPHSYNLLDSTASRAIVAAVRPLVDVLVVTFHGGLEGAKAVRTPSGPELLGRERRGDLRRWTHAMIDAGADVVVGHGPHVLRGVEFYRGRPIAYSLGNFVTYRGFNLEGPLGLTTVLRLELDAQGGFLVARMPALVQRPGLGTGPDSTGAAVALLQRVTGFDFPLSGAHFALDGTITAP